MFRFFPFEPRSRTRRCFVEVGILSCVSVTVWVPWSTWTSQAHSFFFIGVVIQVKFAIPCSGILSWPGVFLSLHAGQVLCTFRFSRLSLSICTKTFSTLSRHVPARLAPYLIYCRFLPAILTCLIAVTEVLILLYLFWHSFLLYACTLIELVPWRLMTLSLSLGALGDDTVSELLSLSLVCRSIPQHRCRNHVSVRARRSVCFGRRWWGTIHLTAYS